MNCEKYHFRYTMLERIHVFTSAEQLSHSIAADFWGMSLTEGKKHIALNGGSTPAILFDILSTHYHDKINWSKFHFWWGDERCVPPDDEESNFLMTKEHLLDKIDVPEEQIHRIKGEAYPQLEAVRYGEEIYKSLPPINGLPSFNLVLLGMGDDGHTASIFPNQMDLMSVKDICAVATHPVSGQKRITLSGPVINHARAVYFMITGKSKAKRLSEIVGQSTGYMSYPAARVHAVNGSLNWFLDEAAASELH